MHQATNSAPTALKTLVENGLSASKTRSESFFVEISGELSERSGSESGSHENHHSGDLESYGEDSHGAGNKGRHMCVSRHRRHAIHWKRGEQIGMGSFGKVGREFKEWYITVHVGMPLRGMELQFVRHSQFLPWLLHWCIQHNILTIVILVILYPLSILKSSFP